MAERESIEEPAVTYGTDNIFADIGLPDADERLAKARLASAIQDVIEERGLSQQKAAEVMGLDQPKVSKILRGRLGEFSTERLLFCLLRMGLDIDIVVHKGAAADRGAGALSVVLI